MIDFNFLRIKWPKLAAIAADASRLVEVSPTSAIGTMQNFCEWAADITLDFYDIDTPNGVTQQEKLETLKSTGKVPPEIMAKFHNVMAIGGGRSYRQHEDVVDARRLIDDVHEIARWLNKEADRSGWPPKGESARPGMFPLGVGSSGFFSSNFGKTVQPFLPIILIGAGVLLVVGLGIGLAVALSGKGNTPASKNTRLVISATPTDKSVAVTMATTTLPPAQEAEASVFLDTMEPATKPKGYFAKQWTFNNVNSTFAIESKEYKSGIGLFVPAKTITKTKGSISIKYKLDSKYSWFKFDMGADANIGYSNKYGTYQLRIYADSKTAPIYDSTTKPFDFSDIGVEVDVSSVSELKITLTETKGSKGTLNIVLGNAKLVKAGTGKPVNAASNPPTEPANNNTDAAASPDSSASSTAGESSSPPPDAS